MESEDKKGKCALLEVEDEEARQARLERLFSSISSLPPQQSSGTMPPISERKTFAVPPPSNLLARLEAFLPEIKAANEELAKMAEIDPSSMDIEKIDDDVTDSDEDEDSVDASEEAAAKIREPYIEMNLGLGVFEQRPVNQEHSQSDDDSDSSDTESSEDEDGEGDEDDEMHMSDAPSKDLLSSRSPESKPSQPKIVILSDKPNVSTEAGKSTS
ncbi:hypothetical protein FRC02_007450 [Tulasnella sp. 418]|nr:hypothetical protein FRC02_007450 [Tulasnella sp. 418]